MSKIQPPAHCLPLWMSVCAGKQSVTIILGKLHQAYARGSASENVLEI